MLWQNCSMLEAGGVRQLVIDPIPTIVTDTISTSDFVMSRPAGTVSGDLLISILAAQSGPSTTYTPAPGFTERLDLGGMELATKTAGGSEPTTYSIDPDSGGTFHGTILRIARAAYDQVGSASSNGVDPVAPSINMSLPGLVIAVFWSADGALAFGTPAGMIPIVADTAFAVFTQNVGTGPTGSRATTTGGANARGVLMSVLPA